MSACKSNEMTRGSVRQKAQKTDGYDEWQLHLERTNHASSWDKRRTALHGSHSAVGANGLTRRVESMRLIDERLAAIKALLKGSIARKEGDVG